MTTTVIHTRALTKHLTTLKATVEAVTGIDLDARDGELVAFLGLNGADHTQRGGTSWSCRAASTECAPRRRGHVPAS